MISPEIRKYYENRLAMVGSPAWKDLMDDIREMMTATNTLDAVHDEKTLHFKRGEVSMMRWFLSIAEVSESAYKELTDADD